MVRTVRRVRSIMVGRHEAGGTRPVPRRAPERAGIPARAGGMSCAYAERAAAESDRVVRAQALDACATAAANLAEANVVFEEAINHASWVGATNRSIASAARVSHPTVARIVGAR